MAELRSDFTSVVNSIVTKVACLPRDVSKNAPELLDAPLDMDGAYALYAVWDTGADISGIKPAAVERLGLGDYIVNYVDVEGVNSAPQSKPLYKAGALILPSNIRFVGQKLVAAEFKHAKAEILLGMDVISQGDFAIRNGGGSTTFTFAHPPKARSAIGAV